MMKPYKREDGHGVDIMIDPYKREFDKMSPNWSQRFSNNLVFLTAQENYLNKLLFGRGHVFLNEVLDALGFERTVEGCLVGWLSNGESISFGLPKNQVEGSITLTFNVQGVMFHKIEDITS